MKNILHVISSAAGSESVTIKLGNAIVEKLESEYPRSSVKVLDLSKDPFPHLDSSLIKATRVPGGQDAEVSKRSDDAVSEVLAADIIIVGAPMYNFAIPSTLKGWLDNIVRPGIAFKYDQNGPEGLITGKKVFIAAASGAIYSQGPMKEYDFTVPYLKAVFGFIGVTDITVVRAEGVNMPGMKVVALQNAIESIEV